MSFCVIGKLCGFNDFAKIKFGFNNLLIFDDEIELFADINRPR